MSFSRSFLCALGTAALTGMLAACSTSDTNSASLPIASRQIAPRTSSGALLYVSDPGKGRVLFYAFPSLTYEGELSKIKYPSGICTDPNTQDVWVISDFNKVSEFAHGATEAMRTIHVVADVLNSCAVSPTNGDLALAEPYDYDDAGALLVLKNARGTPKIYQARNLFHYDFVAYDADGNAFVDGFGFGGFELDELPSGGKKLNNATPRGLRVKLRSPGGVQYDGADTAVGYATRGRIYRISDRQIVGITELSGTCDMQQFTIVEGSPEELIVPNVCHKHGDVLLYGYPSGGAPTGEITGLKKPFAVTMSW